MKPRFDGDRWKTVEILTSGDELIIGTRATDGDKDDCCLWINGDNRLINEEEAIELADKLLIWAHRNDEVTTLTAEDVEPCNCLAVPAPPSPLKITLSKEGTRDFVFEVDW